MINYNNVTDNTGDAEEMSLELLLYAMYMMGNKLYNNTGKIKNPPTTCVVSKDVYSDIKKLPWYGKLDIEFTTSDYHDRLSMGVRRGC